MKNVTYDHNQILENKFEKSDAIFYLRNLGVPFFIQFILIGLIISNMVRSGINPIRGMIVVIPCLLIAFGCFGFLVYKRVSTNRGMKEAIERIGLSNIQMDLNDPENEVFYLHPDRYETYTVISSRYVYFSKEAIYPINEIKNIYIDVKDMSCQIKSGATANETFDPKSNSARNIVKFCKPAYITTIDGKTDRKLIALYPEDLNTVNDIFRSISENARY